MTQADIGRTWPQSQLRTALGSNCTVPNISISMHTAIAVAGPYSRLRTGTVTMPEPKPAKPRSNPAAMAVAMA